MNLESRIEVFLWDNYTFIHADILNDLSKKLVKRIKLYKETMAWLDLDKIYFSKRIMYKTIHIRVEFCNKHDTARSIMPLRYNYATQKLKDANEY